jgi:hypothetical protein
VTLRWCWVNSSRRFETNVVTSSSGPSSPRILLGMRHPEDEGITFLRNVGNCLSKNKRHIPEDLTPQTYNFPVTNVMKIRSAVSVLACCWYLHVLREYSYGRAMAQAVSRRPLTAEARVQSWVSPCGICGGRNGTGTGFSPPSTLVSPVSFITRKNEKTNHLHRRVMSPFQRIEFWGGS